MHGDALPVSSAVKDPFGCISREKGGSFIKTIRSSEDCARGRHGGPRLTIEDGWLARLSLVWLGVLFAGYRTGWMAKCGEWW